MHAVTNTQSKKGNGLGMVNVMYDKFFAFFLVLFICFSVFLSCSLDKLSLSFYFTEFGPHLVFVFLKIKNNS